MDRAIALRSDLEVDLAVIGAGAAGLLMARAAAAQGRCLRLIVLEPRRLSPNPRLWLFPARPGHPLDSFVSLRLDRVRIHGLDRPLGEQRLDLVRARDVQNAALDRLTSLSAGALEEGVRIDSIEPSQGAIELNTSHGAVRASAVIDTRPGPLAAVPDGGWTQVSWFTRAPSAEIPPGFSISRADIDAGTVLMEQTLALPDGSALIEMVGLCPPGEDGGAVKRRLVERLAQLGASADETQLRRAVLPVCLTTPPGQSRDGLVHAPAGSGGLRFGAGRAALRLARWASHEAGRFARTGRIAPPALNSHAERRAAEALLARLKAGPEAAAAWINTALASPNADHVLRFLAGASPRPSADWPWRRKESDA